MQVEVLEDIHYLCILGGIFAHDNIDRPLV